MEKKRKGFSEKRICVDCGKEFIAQAPRAERCMDCRYQHHLERVRKNNEKKRILPKTRKCVDCGEEFIVKSYKSVRCPECRKKHNKEQQKEWNRKRRAGQLDPKPKKYDPDICNKIASCYYGGYMGSTRICDFLGKTGVSRPCRAGECYFYKRKGKKNDNEHGTLQG